MFPDSLPDVAVTLGALALVLTAEAAVRMAVEMRRRNVNLSERLRVIGDAIEGTKERAGRIVTEADHDFVDWVKAKIEAAEQRGPVRPKQMIYWPAGGTPQYVMPAAVAPARTADVILGLRDRLKTNRITVEGCGGPCNRNAYAASDLIRDTVMAARAGGGDPDVLLISTDFVTAFPVWGYAIRRLERGVAAFGTLVSVLDAPFLGSISVVEVPTLPCGTAVALTSAEIRMRYEGPAFSGPQDTLKGQAGSLTIDIGDESHHAWLEGVLAFTAN